MGFAGFTVKVMEFVAVDPGTANHVALMPVVREFVCDCNVQPV